ncbi:hypothetical protein NUBL13799_12460 [Klebsiella pneumoniae]|nr:hypothetical protein NUBL13784_23220 [Klebsiella pneumoniae]GKJ06219.1 hypothetical protein NUBL21978_49530 [Klebsiella pneumoniae]GKJ94268.1 hypothetical protein NUBL9661_15770 [Klebsiella pneumoniae]GKL40953.1 hypothetical protein NUBL13799_12460 [Klebsiella pneumoniae]GKN14667.1 hypothetical protein NUBL22000_42340 [Klebsiella pneumoniae]
MATICKPSTVDDTLGIFSEALDEKVVVKNNNLQTHIKQCVNRLVYFKIIDATWFLKA